MFFGTKGLVKRRVERATADRRVVASCAFLLLAFLQPACGLDVRNPGTSSSGIDSPPVGQDVGVPTPEVVVPRIDIAAKQPSCVPDCGNKECGADGCGGSCGTCPADCVDGLCQEGPCSPDCVGKECGEDGCGGSCGECPLPQHECVDGSCTCAPKCDGKECGPDGCGESCGHCQGETICSYGTCDKCPDGWSHWGTSCYKHFPSARRWNGAVSFCKSLRGSHLVSPASPEENDFVCTQLGVESMFFIGLSDKEVEGTFVWLKEGELDYGPWGDLPDRNLPEIGHPSPPWAVGKPNNVETTVGPDANCVQVLFKEENKCKWNDVSCADECSIICELPSQ